MRERALAIRAGGRRRLCRPLRDFGPERSGSGAVSARARACCASRRRRRCARRRHFHAVPRQRCAGGARPHRLRLPVRPCARDSRSEDERAADRHPQGQLRGGRRLKLPSRRRSRRSRSSSTGSSSARASTTTSGRRDRLLPRDRQGEGRHRALAGDVPGAVRHLPQERDDRPPVHPRRQGRAALRPAGRPTLRPMKIGFLLLTDHSEAVNGKLYMTGGGWNVLRFPGAAARVGLPHRTRRRRRLGRDQPAPQPQPQHP